MADVIPLASRDRGADRQVESVLAEYEDQLPLALRQIFYRPVGAHGHEKTERAYKRLTEAMNKVRRARLISMEAIRDDGFTSQGGGRYASVEAFLELVELQAKVLRLDRQKGQARRIVIWCEASGMEPQIASHRRSVWHPRWSRPVASTR